MHKKMFLRVKHLSLHGRATAGNGSSSKVESLHVSTNMKSPETVNQLILVNLTLLAISAEWLHQVPAKNSMTQTSRPRRLWRVCLSNWGSLIPVNNASLKKPFTLSSPGAAPSMVAEFGRPPILATLMKSTTRAGTSSPATFQCIRANACYLQSQVVITHPQTLTPNTNIHLWKM